MISKIYQISQNEKWMIILIRYIFVIRFNDDHFYWCFKLLDKWFIQNFTHYQWNVFSTKSWIYIHSLIHFSLKKENLVCILYYLNIVVVNILIKRWIFLKKNVIISNGKWNGQRCWKWKYASGDIINQWNSLEANLFPSFFHHLKLLFCHRPFSYDCFHARNFGIDNNSTTSGTQLLYVYGCNWECKEISFLPFASTIIIYDSI